MKAILQLIGPPGVGKTTLSQLLVQELSGQGLLILDVALEASRHESLSHRLQPASLDPEQPESTLGEVVHSFLQKPTQSNEAIDWAFRDLVIPVGEENDLVRVGSIPNSLAPGVEKMLAYGLHRLLAEYEYIIVDGYHPLLAKLLPPTFLQTLVIVTPEQREGSFIPETDYRTPALITNRYEAALISPGFQAFIDEALEAGKVRLIGKLPNCLTPQAFTQELPKAFHNALLRLDIPHNASSTLT